ncbi:DinB family protein [Chitinophaga skermanii]|uniref:DinB family protein n=1 Tax=Chitinophaga skermanii TaxID=331697 RepID=A0A327R477_9BACT|nr:DinB family protein [Chitinophaga skermanii]RAJ10533.1 DinB family protein [Chitinophaga skermanii]
MRNVVQIVKEALVANFKEIDRYFDKDVVMLHYKPSREHWNMREVLEHVSLTNYFLLLVINKATRRALDKKVDGLNLMPPAGYHEKFTAIDVIGSKSFGWINPQHLEPNGEKDMHEVRNLLKQQFAQCMYNLSLLKNGEGRLVQTMMSVNNLGRLDIYQYIYFLTKHIERHIRQMQKLEKQFETRAVLI